MFAPMLCIVATDSYKIDHHIGEQLIESQTQNPYTHTDSEHTHMRVRSSQNSIHVSSTHTHRHTRSDNRQRNRRYHGYVRNFFFSLDRSVIRYFILSFSLSRFHFSSVAMYLSRAVFGVVRSLIYSRSFLPQFVVFFFRAL